MASLAQLSAPRGLVHDAHTRKSALKPAALRDYSSRNVAARRSSSMAIQRASKRLLRSSLGVVATGSGASSTPPPSSTSSGEFFRMKYVGRLIRQFIEGRGGGIVPGRNASSISESAGEPVRDGRPCRATAMAAVIFVALSLLPQQAEAGAMAAAGFQLPAAFPWEKTQLQQSEPSKGTCATCIGVVDETLGACNATSNCVSSFDDRPRFFLAPWEFPGKLPMALEKLREVLLGSGGQIEEQGERYLRAVFTSKEGVVDDVEFLFSNPREDATVVIRSASRAINSDDNDRNRKRLEEIRRSLTWEQVPVLRNRKRTFFFLESPWDTFGPEPPPSFDFKDNLEFVPD